MQSLDERLAELRGRAGERVADAAMCRRKAGDFEHEAMVIEAEIRGIETALAALQPQAGNGAEPPRQRRERRDIKALVRAMLTEEDLSELSPNQARVDGRNIHIAQQVGCKPYRVRAIVQALRKERWKEAG